MSSDRPKYKVVWQFWYFKTKMKMIPIGTKIAELDKKKKIKINLFQYRNYESVSKTDFCVCWIFGSNKLYSVKLLGISQLKVLILHKKNYSSKSSKYGAFKILLKVHCFYQKITNVTGYYPTLPKLQYFFFIFRCIDYICIYQYLTLWMEQFWMDNMLKGGWMLSPDCLKMSF